MTKKTANPVEPAAAPALPPDAPVADAPAAERLPPPSKRPAKTRAPRQRSLAPEVHRLLIDATPAAARALIALVEDPETSASVRCQAAEHILNRVYGKAAQPIDASVGGNGGPVIVAFAGVLADWAK